jgi:hypothetical protein
MQNTSKRMIFQEQEAVIKKPIRIKPNAVKLKLKLKSNSDSKAKLPMKVHPINPIADVFSNETPPPEQTFNFLDKNGTKINKNHNFVSKSMGRDTFNQQNKVKILDPQYETAVNPIIQNRKEIFRKARNMHELSKLFYRGLSVNVYS